MISVPVGWIAILFAPDDCTVTAPVELLTMVNACPRISVEVTGRTTVWVVVPVKNCCCADATVSVVVPAAVAVVAYPCVNARGVLTCAPIDMIFVRDPARVT